MENKKNTLKNKNQKDGQKAKKDRVEKEIEAILSIRDSYRPLSSVRKSLFKDEEVLSAY